MLDAKQCASLKPSSGSQGGVLRQLARSDAGNVMALTAASILPMLAVIGGAVDISRVYLTKSRIQAACDSAVLAGRKAMTTAIYTDSAKARAQSMFNVNFQDADYGTNTTSFVTSADNAGKVSGTGKTTLPMVIMGMFGAKPYKLTVNCSADIQVPNIDVVLVLDVTGSMDQSISGKKKIESLKIAAKDFYDTLTAAMAGNTTSQLRYGFVPYSEAVNGTDVFKNTPDLTKGEASLSHFADSMKVQSRVARFTTPVYTYPANSPTTDTGQWEVNGSTMTTSNCSAWVTASATTGGGPAPTATTRTTYKGSSSSNNYNESTNWGYSGAADTSGNNRTCRRWKTTETTTYKTVTRYGFTDWTYQEVDVDVSNYKKGNAISYVSSNTPTGTVEKSGTYDIVTLATMGIGSTGSTNWNGCIEERSTTAAINFAPIPSNAYDLNYLDGGTSDVLRWRPTLPGLTYDRQQPGVRSNTTDSRWTTQPQFSCPTASMRNLNVMTKTQFYDYIDTLQPNGNTYLDVGMIWGLRLISPQGMFASRNLTGPNGGQISRHVIFLTDGEPVSANDRYTAYNVERMAKRITGSTGEEQKELHRRRFQALCDAQRGVVSIWAIALGTSVTTNMSGCADPGRAYQANNTTELQNAFKSIAKEVADLRLVQ